MQRKTNPGGIQGLWPGPARPAVVRNLNDLRIENADGPDEGLKDYRAVSQDGLTTVLFKNLEDELVARIQQADVVVGCVAWLTSERILRKLAERRALSWWSRRKTSCAQT